MSTAPSSASAQPSAPPNLHQHHQKKRRSTTRTLVKAYLVAYNLLSATGWSLVLYRTLAHLFTAKIRGATSTSAATAAAASILASLKASPPFVWVPSFIPVPLAPLYGRACTAYSAVGGTTARVQSVAVLEILHVLFGFVRSPLGTTTAQVASRLFSVWGIAARFPSAQCSPFYASMVLSWSLTEVIRYTFYAASLIGWEPAPLVWARYSFFFVLYPTGAGSEALVNLATLPFSIASGGSWFSSALPLAHWDAYTLVRAVLFILWWPGLYPMYTHMIKQRRKAFGGQKLGAKPQDTLTSTRRKDQ
ncbi:tyrosine phosphatase-like protein [Russula compacta]|nr:tyrosine phosphatase-like protein [Russula compacta]